MTTTTAHGLPIPEETDPLGESDERIIELAEFIDDELFTHRTLTGQAASDELTLIPDNNGAPFFDHVVNGNLPNLRLARLGRLVQLSVALVLNDGGAPIAPGTSGDIANIEWFFRVMAPEWRPLFGVNGSSGPGGRVATFHFAADGRINMSAVAGTANLESGQIFHPTFTYIAKG